MSVITLSTMSVVFQKTVRITQNMHLMHFISSNQRRISINLMGIFDHFTIQMCDSITKKSFVFILLLLFHFHPICCTTIQFIVLIRFVVVVGVCAFLSVEISISQTSNKIILSLDFVIISKYDQMMTTTICRSTSFNMMGHAGTSVSTSCSLFSQPR